jgi:hypothetical protein
MLCSVNESTMALLHYQIKKMEDGTRLNITYEVEESNPLISELLETMKLSEVVRKLQDESLARMQAHFDPSLKVEELIANMPPGEMVNKSYQAHSESLSTSGSPRKVADYMASPEFTNMIRDDYKVDFGRAFQDRKAGLYKLKADFFGVKNEPDILIMSYEPDKHIFLYMEGNMRSRIQIVLKPKAGGTEVSIAYMLDAPSAFSTEVANTLANTVQLPKFLEQVLIRAKAAIEGTT